MPPPWEIREECAPLGAAEQSGWEELITAHMWLVGTTMVTPSRAWPLRRRRPSYRRASELGPGRGAGPAKGGGGRAGWAGQRVAVLLVVGGLWTGRGVSTRATLAGVRRRGGRGPAGGRGGRGARRGGPPA